MQPALQSSAQSQQSSAQSSYTQEIPRAPGVAGFFHGFNAGVSGAAVHDSAIGWYSIVSPAASYAVSTHLSADASVSIYPYRLVENPQPGPNATQQLTAEHNELSDTFIALHASFFPPILQNTATFAFTLPSGSKSSGLGAGRPTFDFSEHLVHFAGPSALLLDLGAGDSAGLFNNLVAKDYNTVGPLAHFQAGAGLWLLGRNYLQSVAYEQLPFGSQTVYATVGPPGAPNAVTLTSTGASEDNGFTTSLNTPLTPHIAIYGYYNRSLRHHLDTVSFGTTFSFRAMPIRKSLSLMDRALREAEGANP